MPPSADQTIPTPALREIRLGLVPTTRELRDAAVRDALANALGPLWSVIPFESYSELASALGAGAVDLAWLPPVAYVRARERSHADLVLTIERARSISYTAALISRRDSVPQTWDAYVVGKRAAWVDPWSASGYLIPRRMLRAAGHDPDRALASQSFLGSHTAVIEAVVRGIADVAGTFCSVDAQQQIVHSAWTAEQHVRVLALSDSIPADTICVTPKLGLRDGRAFAARLVSLAAVGTHRDLLRATFGADRFVPGNPDRYDELAVASREDPDG